MQNQQNKLQEDNEKLRSVVQGTKSGTTEQKSVTEDKKAESNPPKNTQAEEESTTQVEEKAQTTTSAPKSDAEDKPKKVTNPSMNEIQQQTLSEILDMLNSDSTTEEQQVAIEEIVRSYRTATVKEAPAPEEETLSQEPKFVGFGLFFEGEEQEEPEYEEEEEGILDSVDHGDDWGDDTIFPDLFTANNLVRAAFAVAIIFVVCVGIRVFA